MRKAATSVSVSQCPCGTFATKRSPRAERPWWRTILVVTAVSSMNTSRGATSLGCSAFSSARAAATSGRSCSAACRVFFEGDVVTLVEAPDRANTGFMLLHATQPRTNLLERQVRLRCDEVEQPLPVLLKRRAAMAGSGLGVDAAGPRPPLNPGDRSRCADAEQTRRLPRALARLDNRDRPHSQVLRISQRH